MQWGLQDLRMVSFEKPRKLVKLCSNTLSQTLKYLIWKIQMLFALPFQAGGKKMVRKDWRLARMNKHFKQDIERKSRLYKE